MNKREFYSKLVKALKDDGYFVAHTNNDAYNNPYQVSLYRSINNYTTKSPIKFVVRCNRNIVYIYEYSDMGNLKLDDNLTLMSKIDRLGFKGDMIASTVKQLKELATEYYYSIDDVIEFYRDNDVELLNEYGTLDVLYFDQVTNDTFIYDDDDDVMDGYLYIGGL